MIGFIIWSLFGVFIIGLGIKDMFSKNLVGFWANTETIKVKDVKGYNRATGRLFLIRDSKNGNTRKKDGSAMSCVCQSRQRLVKLWMEAA